MTLINTQSHPPVTTMNVRARRVRLFGTRELLATIAGTLLYAAILWFTSFAQLSSGLGVELRPGIVVPIIFGFVYGPVVGFGVGVLGNTLSDYSLWGDIWWQWSVGNGIMGLIPGIYALFGVRYRTGREMVYALLVTALGIVAGMGFASYSTIFICQEGIAPPQCYNVPTTTENAWEAFAPAVRVNLINALILIPILLFNIERLDLRSLDFLRSGLLRRLLLAIVVSAALPVFLFGFFLTQRFSGTEADTNTTVVRIIGTIIVTLLFVIANAGLVAESLSKPLLRLTRAARLMQANQLTPADIEALNSTGGDNEIAQLSRMFAQMAKEVIEREERLRLQVEELRIEIDTVKQAQQVSEIVDSDFFNDLAAKSRSMRNRRQGPAAASESEVKPVDTPSGEQRD